ncbi:MAG TPA: CDP-diacylglycerol--serine O-phosphatidyltransferase, partial [Roseobacter sp.]|nr:CDP-diacylglycerol--serine O-phosphatidyltransferase [Roseobacter sp.]
MTDQSPVPTDKGKTEFSLLQLLPNMLTIAAICAGISAIRFAAEGKFSLAVVLITVAAILDGMDGRTARYLGSDSKIGAELDSLADFVNFGVAPPLVVY